MVKEYSGLSAGAKGAYDSADRIRYEKVEPAAIESLLRSIERDCIEQFNVHVELVYFLCEDVVTIHRIRAKEQGAGSGTAALKYICSFADKYQLRMDLVPVSDFSCTDQRLVQWYSRHGFVYKNHQMYREPLKQLNENKTA